MFHFTGIPLWLRVVLALLVIDIGDYHIGSSEMDFYCTEFKTENILFDVPSV